MNDLIHNKVLEIASSLISEAKIIFPEPYDHNKQYHEACAAEAPRQGLYLEFGVLVLYYYYSNSKCFQYSFDEA